MVLDHTAWWQSMPSPAALDVLTARQPWDWGKDCRKPWGAPAGRGEALPLACPGGPVTIRSV